MGQTILAPTNTTSPQVHPSMPASTATFILIPNTPNTIATPAAPPAMLFVPTDCHSPSDLPPPPPNPHPYSATPNPPPWITLFSTITSVWMCFTRWTGSAQSVMMYLPVGLVVNAKDSPSLRLAVGGKRWGAKGSRSSCRLCTVEMGRKGAGEGKRDKKADTIPQQPRQNRPRKD